MLYTINRENQRYRMKEGKTMKCPNCGGDVPDRFSFCPQCGTHVRDVAGNPIVPEGTQAPVELPAAPKAKKALNVPNLVLCGVLAANLIGGAMIFNGVRQKNNAAPDNGIAEVSAAETTAAVTDAPAEETVTETIAVTTEPETTPAPQTTTEAPKQTTAVRATELPATETQSIDETRPPHENAEDPAPVMPAEPTGEDSPDESERESAGAAPKGDAAADDAPESERTKEEVEEQLTRDLNEKFKHPFSIDYHWMDSIPPDENGKLRMIVCKVP